MAKISSVNITTIVLSVLCCLINIHAYASEPDHFRKYSYPLDGFEISFPSKPLKFRSENKANNSYSNSYQAVVVNPISQYSIFVQHSPNKVFSDAAIAAYFDGIVRGLMSGSDNAVLNYTKRIQLLDFPAIEYCYAHTINDIPVIGRGIVVMIDGNHIRLSQIYTEKEHDADRNFNVFVTSFKLAPIEERLSSRRYEDKSRGISFAPPNGWEQKNAKFTQIPALFVSPSGNLVQILDSGIASYTCDVYKNEVQATQGIQASGEIVVRGRSMKWIKSTVFNSEANIRVTGIHYCMNTSRGALILNGVAPEVTFIRSEQIFHKVALSLEARK